MPNTIVNLFRAQVIFVAIGLSTVADADGGASYVIVTALIKIGSQIGDVEDRSDWKAIFLPYCGHSREDGENRSSRLGRYVHELRDAANRGDVELAAQRAERLQDTIQKSSMYQQCWNAMRGASQVWGYANQVIRLYNAYQGNQAACSPGYVGASSCGNGPNSSGPSR